MRSLILAVGWLWCAWRIYTLTVNWASFPNPDSARAIWQRRSNFSLWLGAAMLNDTLYSFGVTERWWVIVLSLLGCFVVMAFVQPLLIPAAKMLTIRNRARKMMLGQDPSTSFFVQRALWVYLTPGEREAHGQL